MIRNLRAGIPCRILAYVHAMSGRLYAFDHDGMIPLVGRVAGLRGGDSDIRTSLYGHRSYRREAFFVEEVERKK